MLPFAARGSRSRGRRPDGRDLCPHRYRVLDPSRSEDFYVNKPGLKKVGEGDLGPATDHRIAFIEDPDGYKIELVQRGTTKVGEMYR